MKIEMTPIDRVVPYIRNPRINTEAAVSKVKSSLHEFGWRQPIVVDKEYTIVVGHTRYLAAKQLGLTEVPVHVADNLSPAQIQAYRITDNRSAQESKWDDELLKIEFADLKLASFDLSLTAFDTSEIDLFIKNDERSTEGDTEPELDRADELRKEWNVETGQLWSLGKHRLLCGDSTKKEDVKRLMKDEFADLCFTSPPYGQQRDYRDGGKVSDWDVLMQGVFGNLPMSEEGQVLVNLGLIHRDNEWQPYWDGWIQWMRSEGWRRFAWYVWDKTHGQPGDYGGRFAPAHEFIFHFNKQAKSPEKFVKKKDESVRIGGGTGTRNSDGKMKGYRSNPEASLNTHKIPDSVIRLHQQMGGVNGHPAPFPIELSEFIMQSWPGTVYEPFSGSGTTIIASENLQRQCRAIEISPAYCAVALQRYYEHTNTKPILVE